MKRTLQKAATFARQNLFTSTCELHIPQNPENESADKNTRFHVGEELKLLSHISFGLGSSVEVLRQVTLKEVKEMISPLPQGLDLPKE
jgi:hypothetical protein